MFYGLLFPYLKSIISDGREPENPDNQENIEFFSGLCLVWLSFPVPATEIDARF